MGDTWHYVKMAHLPNGAGSGWILENNEGLQLGIYQQYHYLNTADEAVDWANMYVRLLDENERAMSDGYRNGA